MKFIHLLFCFIVAGYLHAQPENTSLTFTMNNPQVINGGADFQFDIQLHANNPDTYHFLGTIYFSYNTAAFGSSIANGITLTRLELLPIAQYTIVNVIDNSTSVVAITWEGRFPDLGPTYHTEVPTSAAGLLQVTIPIVDNSELAGISFNTSLMNGQLFGIIGINTNEAYMNPNTYTNDLAAQPLPVELTHFRANLLPNQTTQLDWQTASEFNNRGFDIERSLDGRNWQTIGFVEGHGTTNAPQDYQHIDPNPQPGVNYYRLRQEDFDGQFEFSKIVGVEMKNAAHGIRLFPNPATGTVTLTLESDYSGEATLTLHDGTGKLVKTSNLSLGGSAFQTEIGLGDLPVGMYLAKVQAGREQWQEKLVVK